jgi:hypothetical protein
VRSLMKSVAVRLLDERVAGRRRLGGGSTRETPIPQASRGWGNGRVRDTSTDILHTRNGLIRQGIMTR